MLDVALRSWNEYLPQDRGGQRNCGATKDPKVLLSPASVNYDKAMRDSMMRLVTRALPTKTKDLCVQVCAHESIPYTFQQTLLTPAYILLLAGYQRLSCWYQWADLRLLRDHQAELPGILSYSFDNHFLSEHWVCNLQMRNPSWDLQVLQAPVFALG